MKLTNYIRSQIVREIIKDTFSDRQETLKIQKQILMNKVYEESFTYVEHNVMKAYPNMFPKISSFCVYDLECKYLETFIFNESKSYCQSNKSLYFEKCPKDYYTQYLDIRDKMDAVENEKHELENRLRGMVYSVNTTNQLLQIWPDVVEIYPKLFPHLTKTNNLPAIIQIDDIKNMIETSKNKKD